MRLRTSILAVITALALPLPIAGTASATTRTSCPLVEQSDVAYTTDPVDHHLYYGDVWRPDDGGQNHPGVVVMHGGGFTSGSRGQMTDEAQTLACASFVVLNVDYRLTGVLDDA